MTSEAIRKATSGKSSTATRHPRRARWWGDEHAGMLRRASLLAWALALAPSLGMAAPDQAAPATLSAVAASPTNPSCPALLQHTFNSLQTGKPQSLCQYTGKVLLIVNTATYCGYTHQYEGLEALYRKYKERGLVVLGFPSNDFGSQEPGSNKEIEEFCRTTYGIEFPMFEKTEGVKVAANPLYAELTAKTGQTPKWNFHKYLVDRSGNKVQSFASGVEPGQREFVSTLEKLLADKPM